MNAWRVVVLLSLVPHVFVLYVGWRDAGPSPFLVALFGGSLLPVLAGYLLTRTRYRSLGLAWLGATLVGASWAVWVGILHPHGSTASLILLFMPVWNLFVIGPAGAGIMAVVRWLWPRTRGSS